MCYPIKIGGLLSQTTIIIVIFQDFSGFGSRLIEIFWNKKYNKKPRDRETTYDQDATE